MQEGVGWLAQAGKIDENLLDLMAEVCEIWLAAQDDESLRLLGEIVDEEL